MAHEVFICYAKEDESIADAVCKALEERGIRCWYAVRDVPFGTPFEAAIIDAISKARLMLLVLSSYSNASPHVTREIQNAFADDVQVPVIPFRVEDLTLNPALKYYIHSVQWFDASKPPLESHLERLGAFVASHLPEAKDAPVDEAVAAEPQAGRRKRQDVVAAEAVGRAAHTHIKEPEFHAGDIEDAARRFEQEKSAGTTSAGEEESPRVDEQSNEEAERYREAAGKFRDERREPQRQEEQSDERYGLIGSPALRRAEERDKFFSPRNRRLKQIVVAAVVLLLLGVSAMWLWSGQEHSLTASDHIAAGDEWYRQKKFDRAEAEYKKAVQMEPNQADWHHRLGDILFKQGRYEGAEAEFKRAVELSENNASYQSDLAFAHMMQQNWKDAAARLEKAVGLDKTQSPWFNKLGVCYYNLQNYQAAENAFRQLLKLVENSPKNFAYYHINLGDTLYAQRRWADALNEYKEAVRIGANGTSNDADRAMYQERLDNATKSLAGNPQAIDPPQLVQRNYKS